MKHIYYLLIFLIAFAISGCDIIDDDTDKAKFGSNSYDSTMPIIYKTGQTESYDQSANFIEDGTIKDDGYYQKGETKTFYRDDGSEIVYDNKTGLMWQDKSFGSVDAVTNRGYKYYCEDMILAGYDDWRFPTVNEFSTIVDYSKNTGSMMDDVFKSKVEDDYLSSTYHYTSDGEKEYFYFDFSDGTISSWGNSGYLKCVRGGDI